MVYKVEILDKTKICYENRNRRLHSLCRNSEGRGQECKDSRTRDYRRVGKETQVVGINFIKFLILSFF